MKILFFLVYIVLITGCINNNKVMTGLEGKPMPSFDLLLEDSITHINTKDIPTGKPIVLFAFQPYCPYCRAQMKEILENISILHQIRIYAFTSARFTDMKLFCSIYHLTDQTKITIGIDSLNSFSEYYNCTGVPYLAIYDSNKRLKQAVLGKTNVKFIKDIALQ